MKRLHLWLALVGLCIAAGVGSVVISAEISSTMRRRLIDQRSESIKAIDAAEAANGRAEAARLDTSFRAANPEALLTYRKELNQAFHSGTVLSDSILIGGIGLMIAFAAGTWLFGWLALSSIDRCVLAWRIVANLTIVFCLGIMALAFYGLVNCWVRADTSRNYWAAQERLIMAEQRENKLRFRQHIETNDIRDRDWEEANQKREAEQARTDRLRMEVSRDDELATHNQTFRVTLAIGLESLIAIGLFGALLWATATRPAAAVQPVQAETTPLAA